MLETVGGTITRCLNRVLGTIGAGVIGYVTVSITFALDNSIWRALWLYAVAGTHPNYQLHAFDTSGSTCTAQHST